MSAREHGMLFNTAMVRVERAGIKTQTRRIVKPQPSGATLDAHLDGKWLGKYFGGLILPSIRDLPLECPYGKTGDCIWVRETFYAYGVWQLRPSKTGGSSQYHFVDMTLESGREYQYAADSPDIRVAKGRSGMPGWHLRPSIHMPRAASRILLEIVSVRVERLQDISEADALAEGVVGEPCDHKRQSCKDIGCCGPTAKGMYAALWDLINGAGNWAANPWVWVIEFRRAS